MFWSYEVHPLHASSSRGHTATRRATHLGSNTLSAIFSPGSSVLITKSGSVSRSTPAVASAAAAAAPAAAASSAALAAYSEGYALLRMFCRVIVTGSSLLTCRTCVCQKRRITENETRKGRPGQATVQSTTQHTHLVWGVGNCQTPGAVSHRDRMLQQCTQRRTGQYASCLTCLGNDLALNHM